MSFHLRLLSSFFCFEKVRLTESDFAIITPGWVEIWDVPKGNFLHSFPCGPLQHVGGTQGYFLETQGMQGIQELPSLFKFTETPVTVNVDF